MRSVFICLAAILLSGITLLGQTPSATPIELKLERLGTISEVRIPLKSIPETAPKFEGKEDHFRIRLPADGSYKPSKIPSRGEMPTPGRAQWKMAEATIEISVVPVPPGLIPSWSESQLQDELMATIGAGMSNAGAKKVYEKPIKSNGLSGREAKLVAGKTTLLVRAFFANDRQYVVAAELAPVEDAETLVSKAFDSFELVKP